MMIEPESNRLMIPSLYNARDMGGMPTVSGRMTAYKRFIRSDSPSFLDEKGMEELIAYSVRTVIDLRSDQEIRREGNPFLNRSDILFRNIPLLAADPDDMNDPTMSYLVRNSLGHLYIMMLEHSQTAIRNVFQTVVVAPEGAIVFHCMHGKDRTGLIAALLYLLAGVSRENIIRNYEKSYDYIRPLVDPMLENMPPNTHHMYRSDGNNMRLLLDHIDKKYEGHAEIYMEEIGLAGEEIEKIRFRLF
ncbi:MAG: tyrosine-protein phosphatase [Clostridiaceae bacterium]|nr:tyrosine-protein phosphatase [Clostridiaceae bacterium]